MFKKNYWSMSNAELEKLAIRHNIEPRTHPGGDWGVPVFGRPRIISQLIAKDRARQDNVEFVIKTISRLGAITAIAISIILKLN